MIKKLDKIIKHLVGLNKQTNKQTNVHYARKEVAIY